MPSSDKSGTEAIALWALEQLRMWWRGVPRDTSDPAAALRELDRLEAIINVAAHAEAFTQRVPDDESVAGAAE